MPKLFALVLALLATAAAAQEVLLEPERIVDAPRGVYLTHQSVWIANGRVKEIGPADAVRAQAPAGTPSIRLAGKTLMPGLIDVHTHLLQQNDLDVKSESTNMLATAAMSTASRALLGAKLAREMLEAGITAMRDVGNSGVNGDVALRDAIDDKWLVGPRMVVSTRALSPPGGQFGPLQASAQTLVANDYVAVTSAEEGKRAVEQAVYDGADLIKVIVDSGDNLVSPETLAAIVEAAHLRHRKVAAHALSGTAGKIAADAGVDSIEHGGGLSDETLSEMAKKHIVLVPTDASAAMLRLRLSKWNIAEADLPAIVADIQKRSAARLRRAAAAGVVVAAGSDVYYEIPKRSRGEASIDTLVAYQEEGVAAPEIVKFATVNAAELLGLAKNIGSIESGKYADVIAVDGDPLADIRAVQKVCFVMKGGAVIRNDCR